MRKLFLAGVAVLAVLGPAMAQEPAPGGPEPAAPDTPGEKARRGLDLLMQALEGWIHQIPSYAPPEVTPDGDIIIRRLDKPGADQRPAEPPPAEPPALERPDSDGVTRL